MIPLLTALAFADPGDPNVEISVRVGVVYRNDPGHRWGVEAGGGFRAALGDHCSWAEVDCQRSSAWPIVGPVATVSWRGGDRVDLLVGGVGGVAHVDMHHFGFFPLWEGLAVAGFTAGLRTPPSLAFGFDAGRALSYNERVGENGYRTYGFVPLSVRLGAVWRWRPGTPPQPTLRGGLEMCTFAGDYE